MLSRILHGNGSGSSLWLRTGVGIGLLLAFALTGCDRSATSPGDGPRIVTLAPALTQMVVDLGLSEALVGVAQHDMAAPPGLPIVGNFTDVDTERLLSVRPTHVLMTVGKEGIPPRLTSLAGAGHFTLIAYPYPGSVADVARTIYDPDNGQSLGPALGVAEQAKALRRDMLASLEALRSLTGERPARRVLIVIGTDPLMASGPGTVHDELLGYAGGINAAASAAVTAPTYDREALLALDPQVILVLSPGRDRPGPPLPELAGLPIEAVREGRIVVIRDPLAMLPSTSLPRIAAEMAQAIHPELADRIAHLQADGR